MVQVCGSFCSSVVVAFGAAIVDDDAPDAVDSRNQDADGIDPKPGAVGVVADGELEDVGVGELARLAHGSSSCAMHAATASRHSPLALSMRRHARPSVSSSANHAKSVAKRMA